MTLTERSETMPKVRRAAVAVLVAASIAGCAAPLPSATPGPSPGASSSPPPTEASPPPTAGDDLARALDMLEATHPEPFHGIDRASFVEAISEYEAALPDLSADESVVEFMRVWTLLSLAGRDGHQFALPAEGHEGDMLPLRVYEFDEGVFVTDALPPHQDLVGTRVVSIGGHDISEVLSRLEPLIPRDGPATIPAFRPIFLPRTVVLRGLGLVDEGPVEIGVEDASGAVRSVVLESVGPDEHTEWAGPFGHQLPARDGVRYLADPEPFTVTSLEEERTLYLRYRFVSGPAMAAARDALQVGDIRRLILDLRQNPGGDNGTYRPLLAFVREFAAGHPGATFVLTDRVTFSAAANLATEIEGTTDATFVGEPMAGAPNFWDDVRWVELPHLPVPMRAAISTRYWEMSAADDPRLTIEPDIPIPVTAADYFADRDPALDAALQAAIP